MTAYDANLTLEAAAGLLRGAQRMLILTHAKPDGDAWGSVVALTTLLRRPGRHVTACLVPPVPANLLSMPGSEAADIWPRGAAAGAEADLVVVLDTGAWSQIGPWRATIEPLTERMLIIDHHLNGDIPARWRYVDAQAAACCEILTGLADLLVASADRPALPAVVRDALFVGLASDTGWFRFSNTRPQTHRLAARLLEAGVDHADLYRRLEQTERPQKLSLLIRALDSLKLLAGGRAAVMCLRAADFAQTGALLDETERFVDVPQAVGTVELVVLITETPDGTEEPQSSVEGRGPVIRLSFRSKPGPDAVNVAELARRFGGGGHARAAGAKVAAPFEDVLAQVMEVVEGLA